MSWLNDLEEQRKRNSESKVKGIEEAKIHYYKFDPMVRRLLRDVGDFVWGRGLFFRRYQLSSVPLFEYSGGRLSWIARHYKHSDNIEVQLLYGPGWTKPLPRFFVIYTYSDSHYSADTTDTSEKEIKQALKMALKMNSTSSLPISIPPSLEDLESRVSDLEDESERKN
jgi:hypothetical protein